MRFLKEIMRPATYLATALDGTRKKVTITADDCRAAATAGAEMLAAKLRIPAPWKHNLSDPLGPVDAKAKEPDSKDNAGWWERFLYDEATQACLGEIDVPLEEDARKVGTTVCEVSPLLKTFKDGSGREWKNAPFHVALVTHPIMGNQANFQPLEMAASLDSGAGFALALSDIVSFSQEHLLQPSGEVGKLEASIQELAMAHAEKKETKTEEKAEKTADSEVSGEPTGKATAPTMKELLEVLSKIGLPLPEDTTPENLAERIMVAGNALVKSREDKTKTDGEEPITEPVPVAMSLGESNMADSPFKAIAEDQARKGYVARVESLVNTGRLAPVIASTLFKPALEGFAMSIGDDQKPIEPKLFTVGDVLSMFEAFPENTILNVAGKGKTDKNKAGVAFSFEQEPAADMLGNGGEMTPDQIAARVAEQVKKING